MGKNTALAVVDMQNDFRAGSGSPYACQGLDEKLVKNVKKLISACKEKGFKVVYTQQSINPDKSNAERGEPLDVRVCITGTPGWEIIKEIQPKPGDFVVRKHRASAFFKTSLEEELKKESIDSIVFCGVYTNNCVRATAQDAYARDYHVVFISDCCGAQSDGKMSHRKMNKLALEDLRNRQYETEVLTLKEFTEKVNQ
ncbi:MAG TPA: isochorismatase family cysteine hydrolase [archaeon]|nr:isochorismatase family cysteine hydrolase [archaeon]